VSQEGKPMAFHSRKLNPAQTRHAIEERELLSTVETLKECRNTLLGQQIEAFTDHHKNPVRKHFNTERVMQWQLLLEEFGPELTPVKGANNVVADALSTPDVAEEEFSAEALTNELAIRKKSFQRGVLPPTKKQPSVKGKTERCKTSSGRNLKCAPRSRALSQMVRASSLPSMTRFAFMSLCNTSVPNGMTQRFMHPGGQRLELTMVQRRTWIGLKPTCLCGCKNCENFTVSEKRDEKKGLLPPEPNPEIVSWHAPCVDLAGPCKFGDKRKPETHIELHCVNVMDPATGCFEMVEIGQKIADVTANWLEFHWLTRHL